MAISMDTIQEFLDIKNIQYFYDVQKKVLILTFQPNMIQVKLDEQQKFLQFQTLNFFQYKEGSKKYIIQELLLLMNYRKKLVKFAYNTDGEIKCYVDFPIEDNSITLNQFSRCLSAMLDALDEARIRISTVIEVGNDPRLAQSKMIENLVDEIMESINQQRKDPHKT
ncbi:MAG: hypothetical protein KBC30_08655 [Planctomycetes bacterium]|nr:hypothetical protein [Planctomycetota bacterium]HPY74868.1 YbjN domain-containing protein [Planctomycetota bacterium]HQB00894.1 YbjN domain-containing protein [Planctomycetota bacterium]